MSDPNELNLTTEIPLQKTESIFVPEETQTQDDLREMISKHQSLEDREYSASLQFQLERRKAFGELFFQRRVNASLKEKQAPIRQAVEKRGIDLSVPQEPELSEKERKNKVKDLAKKKKAAQKKFSSDACDEYTIDLVNAQVEQMNRDECLSRTGNEVLDKVAKQVKNPKRLESIRNSMPALLVFGPKVLLDKKGEMKKGQEAVLLDYLGKAINDLPKMQKTIKSRMFEEKVNPNKFTLEYIGEHFDELREQTERIRAYLSLYGEGTDLYEKLSREDKAYVRQMAVTYELEKKALREGLGCHNVIYRDGHESGLVKESTPETFRDAVNNLRDHLENIDKKIADGFKQEAIEEEGRVEEEYRRRVDRVGEILLEDTKSVIQKQGKTEQYAYINIPLYGEYGYENIDKVVRSVDKLRQRFPEKYEANKQTIMEFMSDFIKNVQTTSKLHNLRAFTLQMIGDGTSFVMREDGLDLVKDERYKTNDRAQRMAARENDKYHAAVEVTGWLSEAILYLAGGEVPSEDACRLLASKGIAIPEFEGMIKEAESSAAMYVDIPQEKRELFSDLLKKSGIDPSDPVIQQEPIAKLYLALKKNDPEYNEGVMRLVSDFRRMIELRKMIDDGKAGDDEREEAKALGGNLITQTMDIMSELLDEVKKYEMPWLKEGDPNVFIDHQAELIEMSHKGELIKALGSQKLLEFAITDVESQKTLESTIMDEMMGTLSLPEKVGDEFRDLKILRKATERILLEKKIEQLKGGAMKARAAAMLHLSAIGKLNESYFYEGKREQRTSHGTVDETTLVNMAKDIYRSGSAIIEREEKALYDAPVFQEERMASVGNYSTLGAMHRPLTRKMFDFKIKLQAEAKEHKISDGDCFKAKFEELTKNLEFLEKRLADEKLPKELRDEYEKTREEMKEERELTQIVYGISVKSFSFAGEQNRMGQSMFRSISMMDACNNFTTLTESEYKKLLLDMTEGAFLEENAPEKEKEKAADINKKAYKKYLIHAAGKYEKLINKFSGGRPDQVYIREHMEEIIYLASASQEDGELLKKCPELFDLKNEEDARIYNLIAYGTSLCWALDSSVRTSPQMYIGSHGSLSMEAAVESSWTTEQMKESQDALRSLRSRESFRRKFIDDDREALRPQATEIFKQAAEKAREKTEKKEAEKKPRQAEPVGKEESEE